MTTDYTAAVAALKAREPSTMARTDATSAPAPRTRPCSDRIEPGVQVLFVGINPGIRSALTGTPFCRLLESLLEAAVRVASGA